MKKTFLTLTGFFIINLIYGQGQTEKLEKILNRLSEIETVSYYSKSTSSAPGDTLAFQTFERFVNMYVDTADKFVGAKYSTADIDKHYEFDMCYDGNYSVRFDWANKNAQIDTMTDNPYSRPMSPFFITAKSLVEYSINNIDSTIISFKEYQDSIIINFLFKDKLIEFMWLEPFIKESKGEFSRYELILDNTFLPYKFVRKMPHQTSWETCSNIQTSNHLVYEFSSIQQIPMDFNIKGYERGDPKSLQLQGTIAPNWKLKEIYGDSISLDELKHKVILIQFTGIGCGPCHASIPFLKKLTNDYKNKDFELVCIETWSKNISVIERYKDKNEINYKFLVSENEVNDKYKIQGVPAFFILDNKREIKQVIVGYQKDKTEEDIRKKINELL